MILVDTSVWVDHFRGVHADLAAVLESGMVCAHDFVIGELACGNLRNRDATLILLRSLPRLPSADADEVLYFVDQNRLAGQGIGYVDAHLLASAAIGNASLWTADKALRSVADSLGCLYSLR